MCLPSLRPIRFSISCIFGSSLRWAGSVISRGLLSRHWQSAYRIPLASTLCRKQDLFLFSSLCSLFSFGVLTALWTGVGLRRDNDIHAGAPQPGNAESIWPFAEAASVAAAGGLAARAGGLRAARDPSVRDDPVWIVAGSARRLRGHRYPRSCRIFRGGGLHGRR